MKTPIVYCNYHYLKIIQKIEDCQAFKNNWKEKIEGLNSFEEREKLMNQLVASDDKKLIDQVIE